MEKHSTPLADVTTSSLEALKAYSTAMKVSLASGSARAIPFFRRAVEIDPNFAMAYANLGLAYSGVGESVLSAESATKAWQLRERASERERFFITFNYDREVTGNLENAFQTLELWEQTYPRRAAPPDPLELLGGLSTKGTGRWEIAIEHARKTIAAYPDVVHRIWQSGSQSSFFVDRFGEAENALQQAAAHKKEWLEPPQFLVYRYNIAFMKGDNEQMDRVVALAKGKRRAEHWVTNSQALVQARSGHAQLARRLSSRAVDLALQEGGREAAATYQSAAAVWEGLYGNANEAKTKATAALALTNGRDVEYASALALGLAGDSSRSEALADDLDKRFPEDTFVRFTYLPVLRALSALHRGQPTESVERLQTALHYELAVNGLSVGTVSRRPALGLCARRGFAGRAPVCGSGRRVSEDPRSSRDRRRGSDWCSGTPAIGQNVRARRETRPSRRLPTRIFSPSGKTPTPTFRFWCKRRRSTPGCNSASFRTSASLARSISARPKWSDRVRPVAQVIVPSNVAELLYGIVVGAAPSTGGRKDKEPLGRCTDSAALARHPTRRVSMVRAGSGVAISQRGLTTMP